MTTWKITRSLPLLHNLTISPKSECLTGLVATNVEIIRCHAAGLLNGEAVAVEIIVVRRYSRIPTRMRNEAISLNYTGRRRSGVQTVHTPGTDAEPCVLVAVIDKKYEVVAGLDGIVNWAGLSPSLNLFTVTEQDKGIEGTIIRPSKVPDTGIVAIDSGIGSDHNGPPSQGKESYDPAGKLG